MPTVTASQRRAEAKAQYDAYLATCPSRQLLALVSDKWVALVLVALAGGSMRYAELATRIAGVSAKMLTQTLRNLEAAGLVSRTVTPSVPVRVDYALTPLGESLGEVLGHVKQWAEGNMAAVAENREAYARRVAESAQ